MVTGSEFSPKTCWWRCEAKAHHRNSSSEDQECLRSAFTVETCGCRSVFLCHNSNVGFKAGTSKVKSTFLQLKNTLKYSLNLPCDVVTEVYKDQCFSTVQCCFNAV